MVRSKFLLVYDNLQVPLRARPNRPNVDGLTHSRVQCLLSPYATLVPLRLRG